MDPFDRNVENPLRDAQKAVAEAATKTVADLGCGTGPLLPYLAQRFRRVFVLDFAPGMISAQRSGLDQKPAHADFPGAADARARRFYRATRRRRRGQFAGHARRWVIDRTLRSIRASLKPGGQFLGIVPSIDAIYYHLMLLIDQALTKGSTQGSRGLAPSMPSAGITISPSGNFT